MTEGSQVMPYTVHVAVPKVIFQARNTCCQRGVIQEFKVCAAPKIALDLLDFLVRFIDRSVRRTRIISLVTSKAELWRVKKISDR